MMNIIVSEQPMKNSAGEAVGGKATLRDYGSQGLGMNFMELIMQQLTDMQGGDATGALMQQLQNVQDEEENQGTELAMQMLADLLGNNPAMDEVLKRLAAENPEMVKQLQKLAQEGTPSAGQSGVLQQFLEAADASKATKAEKALTYAESATKQTNPTGQENTGEKISIEGNSTQSQSKQAETSGNGLMNGQSRFTTSVQEAKKLLRDNQPVGNFANAVIDVEKLQANADSSRTGASRAASEAALPDPQAVLDQVKTGISKNFADGKDEFVVKLRPEGLGEITVKLAQGSEKITMSIMTSNSQVAKLLSGEIGILKDALRPYNVEVREIVTQTANSNNTQGTESNQQFAQFAGQHQQQNRGDRQAYYGTNNQPESPFPEELLRSAPQTGLDTYI